MEVEKSFISDIKNILTSARQKTYAIANSAMLAAYWKVGMRIVEEEQKGQRRARYGTSLIKELSRHLKSHFGKGFDDRELRRMRQFYLSFPNWDSVQPELTWTHYWYILRIENEIVRKWYIQEAIDQGWNTRQLERNINSRYYERLLSTQKNKESTEPVSNKNKLTTTDLVKDPFMLEFLGLEQPQGYSESDLETAIINKLQNFILELGKGYAFVARQYHIRTDTKDFYIDLVFYNYIFKGFVLLDLKIDELTHQDIGQMDMYVRLWDDLKKIEGDNPTIGIILCSDKDETVVKYSVLNENKQLFASKYRLYLPDEKQLIDEIEREKQVYHKLHG